MASVQSGLSAGFACVNVTPPMGLNIPGYYEKRYADGVLSDLHLRAVAFSDGESKAIVFSCESVGIKADAFDILKGMIARCCGISPDAVYITCVHSHTSFRITKPTEENDANDQFLNRLFRQFCDCAQQAFADLKPCTLRIAKGFAENVAYVRRYRMKDGSAKTNPPLHSPDIVGPIGAPDDSIQMLRIVRQGGKEILLLNFGTHADTIGGTKYSPDWPGYLVQTLNRVLDVESVFLLGAEGDCGSRNPMSKATGARKGEKRAISIGLILAGMFLNIYERATEVPADKIRFFHKYVQIGKNPYDPADVPIAREVQKIYQEKGRLAEELRSYSLTVPGALRILANLDRPEFFSLRVSALQIGNIAFVGIPGEPFASVGKAIKEIAPQLDMTVVTALTNGGEGYFPDAAAFAEPMGYERSSSPFAHDCAQKLIDTAAELLSQMYPTT